MTQQQGDTLNNTVTSMQQTQADMAAKMDSMGQMFGLICWLLFGLIVLTALRRIIGR